MAITVENGGNFVGKLSLKITFGITFKSRVHDDGETDGIFGGRELAWAS
jgi:hypothetical protein